MIVFKKKLYPYVFHVVSFQKRDLETKLSGAVTSSNDAQSKIMMLSSELNAKKKESDLLRQRVAEAALKGDQEVRCGISSFSVNFASFLR